MERKFYPENFERFLKGHADQFKMTPSKKVWHGIYNDLHPGRRWPSIAMSMVFIFTLVIIGHLNTNNGNKTSLHDLASLHNNSNSNKINAIPTATGIKQGKRSGTKDIITGNNNNTIVSENNPDEIINTSDPAVTTLLSTIKNTDPSSNKQAGLPDIAEVKPAIIVENKNELTSSDKIVNNVAPSIGEQVIQENAPELKSDKELPANTTTGNKETITTEKEVTATIIPETNAGNIIKPRKINNISWTYYVTPSLGYRDLSDQQVSNSVIQKTKMGYEAGAALSFNLYKKLQFTAGLQLNYSGFIIKANNTHPTVASIILNGESTGQYEVYSTISRYGNRTGVELSRLKNYSLQASLPIGVQYAFAGNDNIKFNVAASFQPTHIISGKAYILSEDKRNYLTNPDLFRKWNMNTSLSAFVSFSSNSFNWQIGPQVRYQLLSTYTSRFELKENLINYGIRFGISKISK